MVADVRPAIYIWAVLAALAWFRCPVLAAEKAPSSSSVGEYLELHSCEVYTGGCTASSQCTTGGRSLLRVWKFEKAELEGVRLDGLSAVVLEIADANLALPETKVKEAVAYLPDSATAVQRKALTDFLVREGIHATTAKVVPISYTREGGVVSLRAGDGVQFTTRALEHCDAGGCGEQLWYAPRSLNGAYTVLVNEDSRVEEPRVHLIWRDNAAKSVFFGHFGTSAKPEFSLASID